MKNIRNYYQVVHKQQIRDPNTRKLHVSEHIDNCCSKTINQKFTVVPILKVNGEDKSKQIASENWLIKLFEPKLNKF